MNSLDKIAEIIGWIRIFISPFLFGILLGYISMKVFPGQTGLYIGGLLVIAGTVAGVLYANRAWKKHGTIHFISRSMATPELDKPEDEKESNK